MQINWWTLALQAINFLILVWLLQRFLYRPVKAVIEKRKALAGQAFAEAEEKGREADDARKRFEESRDALAAERRDMQKKLHEEMEGERERIVADAREEADALLETARETVARERKAALAEMREQTADLAAELAADMLRRTGAAAAGDVFLAQIEKRLEALPDDERDALRDDIAGNGARLTVVTAAPLADDDRERWRTRLGETLGHPDRTDFDVDADILGGAELRFPHSVLRFTWADQLARARKLMTSRDEGS